MARGPNLPAIAAFNETVVLDAVRRSPDGLSRVELAARTGLSAQTVTNVTRRLLQQGLIREAGKQSEGSPGKPRTILRLNPAGAYAVGVHLDPTVIACVLLDLEGSVVAHVHRPSPPDGDAVSTLAAAVDAIREGIEHHHDPAGTVTAVLSALFLGGTGSDELDRAPSIADGRHQHLSDLLADPVALAGIVDRVLRIVGGELPG